MANGIIPDKLHDFNVYSNANKLIGISGEVKLPEPGRHERDPEWPRHHG